MVYYKIPVHTSKGGILNMVIKVGDFPMCQRKNLKKYFIPMYPYISKENQDVIINTLNSIVSF